MEQTLSVVCGLNLPAEAVAEVEATLQAFAAACSHLHRTLPDQLTNPTTMHHRSYRETRQQFGLSANLAVRAIARVATNRKSAQTKGRKIRQFVPTSVDYDARLFSLDLQTESVSLRLLGGRRQLALGLGDYQRGLLTGQNPTAAVLVKRRGRYFLHIQVKVAVPEPREGANVLGVDLGRRDIAHTSQGKSFSGEDAQRLRDHFAILRTVLQKKAAKGTRSSRRRGRQLLQRLSGRERRFQRWLNHTISARLVRKALAEGWVIALEDLTGIRERTNEEPRRKEERRRANSWAFYQLRQFLGYKARQVGVKVVLVNPAYTSRMCHQCLHLGQRSGKLFRCAHCGWGGDADYNGAQNIAKLGAVVNQPGGPGLFCRLQDGPRATESSTYSACA